VHINRSGDRTPSFQIGSHLKDCNFSPSFTPQDLTVPDHSSWSALHRIPDLQSTMSRYGPGEYQGPISYGATSSGPKGIVPSNEESYAPTYGGMAPGGAPKSPSPQPHQLYYGVPQPQAPVMYMEPQPQYYAAPPVVVGWTPNGYVGAPNNQGPAQSPPPTYGAKEAGWKIPSGGDYTDTIVLSPTIRSEQASMQGPCPILWDVRRNPSSATVTPATGVNPELNQSVSHPPVRSMVIICKYLPWSISIKKYSPIKCKDVIEAVYNALQEQVTASEFWIASPEKRKIMQAVNERETENPRSKRKYITTRIKGREVERLEAPLRADFLDRMTLFKGLYHDSKMISERLAHDPESIEDAWVMALAFSSDDEY